MSQQIVIAGPGLPQALGVGDNPTFNQVTIQDILIRKASSILEIRSGFGVKVYNSLNTKFIIISHNGFTGLIQSSAGVMRLDSPFGMSMSRAAIGATYFALGNIAQPSDVIVEGKVGIGKNLLIPVHELEIGGESSPVESRFYNADDGSGNTEFLSIGYKNTTNVLTIESEATGTGTVRDIRITPNIDVKGPATFVRGTNSTNGNFIYLGFPASAAGQPALVTSLSGVGEGRIFQRQTSGSNDIFIGDIDNTGGGVIFRSAGSNRLSISSSGEVGVATTAPIGKFAIGGDNARPFTIQKSTVAVVAPTAGHGMLRWEVGTNAGTLKVVAYSGTSTTGVTIADNIGAGN